MALSLAWLDFGNFITIKETPMKIKKSTSKITRILLIALLAVAITSCSAKKSGTAEEFAAMTQRVQEGNLRIVVDAAYPGNTYASQQVLNSVLRGTGDTANRIDLSGDGHYLQISPERVQASLPFYGELRQAGSYGTINESGVQFDLVPEDYTVEHEKDLYRYRIKFAADKGIENFNTEVILFANGTATIYVTSNTRTRIEYRGRVVEAVDVE
jgi:hypothetical protein